MDKYLEALHKISPDISRDDWVKSAMAAKAAGISFTDWDQWSSSGKSYNQRDAKAVWQSVDDDGGITAGTLIHMAGGLNGSSPSLSPAHAKKTHLKPTTQAASLNPLEVWGRGKPADQADAYIHQKQGQPERLRIYPASAPPLTIMGQNVAGFLMVPCWSGENLQTIQFIPPENGGKLNLPGSSFNDGFFTVGKITDLVYICEGIGQAWAVNKATETAAVSCFGSGRMFAVSKVLRNKYPDARLVIVPDRGKENQAAEIAAAIAGKYVEMPADKPANYDANDYLQEAGAVKLAALLNQAKGPISPQDAALGRIKQRQLEMMATADSISRYDDLKQHIDGLALQAHHTVIYGASGSFKTTFLTYLCIEALKSDEALGVHYWGFDVSPPYVQAVVKLLIEENLNARFFLFDNQTPADMKAFYSDYLENNIRMDNTIIVLDTLKFLTSDINNKNANKEALHYIKSITKLGAAWVSIGHTNKDGKNASGTAEIEQDSDGLLRIDSITHNGKGIATIKKGGRCRWGEPSITIETIITIEDKENPHLFWYQAIKQARKVNSMDIESIRQSQEKAPQMEIIAEIISDYMTENSGAINKTKLKVAMKASELLDLSQSDTEMILRDGSGKYWQTRRDKADNNKLLFYPMGH